MHKRNVFFVIMLCLCLISCVNKRTNSMLCGDFFGTNEYHPHENYHLQVHEITETEFIHANGVDVMEDLVKKGFYKLDFYSILETNQRAETFHFYNLKDANKGSKSMPICYVDDNHSTFTPVGHEKENPIYTIHIPSSIASFEIYTNLYLKDPAWNSTSDSSFLSSEEPSETSNEPTYEITLQKTIDFEDINKGNMSATAHNSYYDGLIVADGKVTQTSTAKIDNNTLGMRLPANSTTEQRVVTIQTKGYSKIVFDLKQERTSSKISTRDMQTFVGSKNGEIIRDIEIITNQVDEVTLTFYANTSVATTMDCGIDNIRFYGIGMPSDSDSSTSSEVEDSSSENDSTGISNVEESTRENTLAILNGVITMRGIADFLETKEEHYPLSDLFIETYQQTSGGYIDLAKKLGILVDKAQHSPNQKWHFFDSWMYPSIEDKTLSWAESAKSRVYSKLLCPELLLWIYEACGVETSKVQQAMEVAIAGKESGTAVTTIAKNMRNCVAWEDLERNILTYLYANS